MKCHPSRSKRLTSCPQVHRVSGIRQQSAAPDGPSTILSRYSERTCLTVQSVPLTWERIVGPTSTIGCQPMADGSSIFAPAFMDLGVSPVPSSPVAQTVCWTSSSSIRTVSVTHFSAIRRGACRNYMLRSEEPGGSIGLLRTAFRTSFPLQQLERMELCSRPVRLSESYHICPLYAETSSVQSRLNSSSILLSPSRCPEW